MAESWTLPAPLATAEVRMDDGALIILRRHGNPKGQRLVLSHGSGLSADLYYPFWSLLTDSFDIVIYDVRGHGWNPVSDLRVHNFLRFANDNVTIFQAIDRHFGRKPKIGVFHSMSALIAILQEQQDSIFSALLLFEPPLKLPWGTNVDKGNMEYRKNTYTLKRRSRFNTREELTQILIGKPAFACMQPGMVDLLSETVLRPCTDGTGYELCCPVEQETRAWEFFSSWVQYSEIENLACPVKVIGGDPTDQYSFTPGPNLASIFNVDYDFIPETTNLFMLEEPEECAALTFEFLENLEINPRCELFVAPLSTT